MSLSDYDLRQIGKQADEMNFIRDTLEKVYRLSDILEYLNVNPLLKDNLALKGGTAINLTIFNLPRLSVDIDMDYCNTVTRREMLIERELINSDILKYMTSQGYRLSPKTKNPHSLDSWVFEYINAAGNRDNIKLEINYSLRAHILPIEKRKITTSALSKDFKINSLAAIEIFGSKITALLNRTAARDLYDVNNMIYYGLFDESDYDMLRKSVVFYSVISSKDGTMSFNSEILDRLTKRKIKTDLIPVINKHKEYNLEASKARVKDFINELLVLTSAENEFIAQFNKKQYLPELLFDDKEISERIRNHPMALWRVR